MREEVAARRFLYHKGARPTGNMMSNRQNAWRRVVGFVLLITTVTIAYAAPLEKSEDYNLVEFAMLLKQAVINRDIAVLSSMEIYDEDAAPPLLPLTVDTDAFLFGSALTKNDGRQSVRTILSSMRQQRLLFQRYSLDGREYVRVFFFDPTAISLRIPLTQSMVAQWMRKFVTCRFVRVGDNWRIAHTLFDDETQGP